MFMGITSIDLFDQNSGKVGSEVRLRCTWTSLVLMYLIKIQVRYVARLNSDVDSSHLY